MPFEVVKFAASTQAAVTIFHLFQNGLVNMVIGLDESCTEIYKHHFVPAEDSSFQVRSLQELVSRLSWYLPDEVELKIHSPTTSGGNERKTRKVEFSLKRDSGMTQTTFAVAVTLRNQVWVLHEAVLVHRFAGASMEMVIKPIPGNALEVRRLPEQAAQYIGGFVHVESSTF